MSELSGYTVGVAAGRRRDELAALLERRGARVVRTPALRIVPPADDTELRAATQACLASPPGIVLAGTGMRAWLQAAEGWGLAEPLRSVLSRAYVVAHDSAAHAAAAVVGAHRRWTPTTESCAEVIAHLRERGIAGQVLAIQPHGERQPEWAAALEAAGATVIEVAVYRWAPLRDPAPLHRLVDLVTARLIDAVIFTSAPAVNALLTAAGPNGVAVLDALRSDVLAACVGPAAATPLRRHGVPVATPASARLGALVRTLVDELPRRAVTVEVGSHVVTLRGHAAVVDGELRPLAPAPMAVLRALVRAPGRVLSRADLLRALPRGADEHAVEMAVARLRAGLGASGVVHTVVKRGFRLRVD